MNVCLCSCVEGSQVEELDWGGTVNQHIALLAENQILMQFSHSLFLVNAQPTDACNAGKGKWCSSAEVKHCDGSRTLLTTCWESLFSHSKPIM